MKNITFEPINHEYFMDGKEYPSYSKIVKHFGMTPDYERFGNDASRDFGSAVHHLTKLYDTNNLGSYDPRLQPRLNGYKMFLDHFKPKWKLTETPMISERWGFAGTPDRFGGFMGRNSLIDFKSGSEDPSHGLQTAAYQILVEENLEVPVRRRYSLYILDNNFKLIEHKNPSDKTIFIGLAQAYRWKLKHKRNGE